MVRTWAVTTILVLGIAFSSCSASRADGAPIDTKGRVVVIGNEPFTSVAVEALDGTVYRLEADAAVLQKLRSIQGKIIQVVGRLRTEPQGPAVVVESYDVQ
ncbi:MAG: hypothetical protein MUF82_04330 [Bacteroidetes bacterium]|nr:hypothetical protein [Bacteroidota bacterium]